MRHIGRTKKLLTKTELLHSRYHPPIATTVRQVFSFLIAVNWGITNAIANVYFHQNFRFELRRGVGVDARCEFFLGSFPDRAAIAIYDVCDTIGKSYRPHFWMMWIFASILENVAVFAEFGPDVSSASGETSGIATL